MWPFGDRAIPYGCPNSACRARPPSPLGVRVVVDPARVEISPSLVIVRTRSFCVSARYTVPSGATVIPSGLNKVASSAAMPSCASLYPLPPVPANPASAPADLILTNGKIITVDAAFTIARAIAVAGDRIIAVGPDAAMARHGAATTRVIDLHGRSVIPGIVDGHAHMDREGLRHVFPALGGMRSIGDIQDRIAELARAKRPGEWIVSGFGGTLNLVVSLAFVVAVLVVQAVPCFYFIGRVAWGGFEFRTVIIAAMAAIALLSLLACLLPMGMALRAIQRLEL